MSREAMQQALEVLEYNQANWQGKDTAIAALKEALAQPTEQDAKDAARYRHLRHSTCAVYDGEVEQKFTLPSVKRCPGQDLMRGSVAQHFDRAIDAELGIGGKK